MKKVRIGDTTFVLFFFCERERGLGLCLRGVAQRIRLRKQTQQGPPEDGYRAVSKRSHGCTVSPMGGGAVSLGVAIIAG